MKKLNFNVLPQLLLVCIVFLLSACDGNYLVWSTDGKLGAVLGAKGLRVCDGEGTISKVLIDNAGMFRWLPGEHAGLIVGYDYVASWAELKPLLNKAQEKQIADESAKLRRKILTYKGDPKKFAENALRTFDYPLHACLALRGAHQPDLERVASQKWPPFANVKVPIFYIKLVQVDEKSTKLVRVLNRGIDEVVELRPSPNGKAIACVKHENGQERNYIEIIPIVAFAKASYVAVNTNVYPDWSADGRNLYFTRGNNAGESDLLRGAGVHEGGLFKAECCDATGKIHQQITTQKLGRIIFDNRSPVRALKDGRILFLSRELGLPSSVQANPTSTLFALEGPRVDTILHRSDDAVYFEPNQDQEQIAVSFANGSLFVVKSNGTDPTELCNGKETKISGLLPQWKSNSELSYGTETPSQNKGAKPTYSVILYSKSSGQKDLSKAWGKEAASEIIVHRDLFQEAMSGVLTDLEKKK